MKTSSKRNTGVLATHKKYEVLKKLDIKFITPKATGSKLGDHTPDPTTDVIGGTFRWNNTSQVSSGYVRRDEKYHSSCLMKQRTVVDLGEYVMVSKIHFKGLPGASIFNLYVSEEPHGNYHKVTYKKTAHHSQNLRVVDCGNVPARFLMIEVVNGEIIPENTDVVQIFGLSLRQMDTLLGDTQTKMLFDNAFKIVYGFNSDKLY